MAIEGITRISRVRIHRVRELGHGKYSAKQAGAEVMVTATGMTPTPNYKVWLVPGPERIFPPIFELWWMRPPGIQPQVVMPFSVHTTFHSAARIEKLSVRDADGMHEVAVEHVPSSGTTPGERHLANSYRLMWGKIPVSYAATSFMGVPMLSIGDQHFSGDEIHVIETELGQQTTVVTEQVPDLKVVTFTLILPPVLLAGYEPAKVEVPAVQATHHTTIAGPPLGQGISYVQAMLHGEAEFIVA